MSMMNRQRPGNILPTMKQRREAALCVVCEKPSDGKFHCDDCRRQNREYQRLRRDGGKWEPGGVGRPPVGRSLEGAFECVGEVMTTG
jgi:hypothetical protein